jgi:hypothetical protein
MRSRLLRGLAAKRKRGTHVAAYSSGGVAYTPGARVSLRLRYLSQSACARVRAEFRNTSGGVIKLGGVTHPREESGTAYTEVVLTGNVFENVALGTYECRSVEGLIGEKRGRPSSKTPHLTSVWSNDPSTPKEGESFSVYSQPRGR